MMPIVTGNGNGTPANARQHSARPKLEQSNIPWIAFFNPRTWRTIWLAQLSEFMEQYMRSPGFLAWLYCSIALENARVRFFGDPLATPIQMSTNRGGKNIR